MTDVGKMQLNVRMSDGSSISVSFDAVRSEFTVEQLKGVIGAACTPPCPADQQKLVFRGRILRDTETLEAAGTLCVCPPACAVATHPHKPTPTRPPTHTLQAWRVD